MIYLELNVVFAHPGRVCIRNYEEPGRFRYSGVTVVRKEGAVITERDGVT
jgi:hypothetical protein